MAALTVTPTTTIPGGLVDFSVTGLTPRAKTRARWQDSSVGVATGKASSKGNYGEQGISVGSIEKTRTLLIEQQSGSTWTKQAQGDVVIKKTVTPPPPTTGPLQEPKTDVSGIPLPAGWASGSLTLQQAIDQATAGSILNLSAIRTVVLTSTVMLGKPLAIVAYGMTLSAPALADAAFAALADDVTLEGFAGRGLGCQVGVAPGQVSGHDFGAIQLGGYGKGAIQRATLRNLDLSDALYKMIFIEGGDGHRFLGCTVGRGGRSGISGSGGNHWAIQRSRFWGNNTALYDVGDDAAGVKILHGDGHEVSENEFDANLTRGFWTDTGITNLSLHHNRWHDNDFNGAFLESSHYLDVHDNVGYRNGRNPRSRTGGFSGSIAFSSSDHFEAYTNTDAYSGGGITVMSQLRTDDAPHVEGYIHDNTVISDGHLDTSGKPDTYLSGWFEDYNGILYVPASNNRGANNKYYDVGRFYWQGDKDLTAYNATPGEENGRYLTAAEAAAVKIAAGIP